MAKGYHTILINASLYNQNRAPPSIFPPDHLHFSMTTSPYKFSVGETTTTPLPTFPNPSPTPTLSPIPSSFATQQPTLKPSQTTDNTQAENYTPLVIIFGLVLVAVMLGVLVYFKKIKK